MIDVPALRMGKRGRSAFLFALTAAAGYLRRWRHALPAKLTLNVSIFRRATQTPMNLIIEARA